MKEDNYPCKDDWWGRSLQPVILSQIDRLIGKSERSLHCDRQTDGRTDRQKSPHNTASALHAAR